jgi:hypothetical protein
MGPSQAFRGAVAKVWVALATLMGGALTTLYFATIAVAPSAAAATTCSQPGGQFAYGSAVVGIAATPDDGGYWIVNNVGQIAACGDATWYGQPSSLNKPIVGIAATPNGRGYYEVASDGGIFAFGNAQFQGSTGGIVLNKPIVGMAVDPVTGGYWLVASDGGIFAYNAPFLGSTGSIKLNQPVVGMAAVPNGSGYWFVASDGGIFAYGVPFYGSTGSMHLNKPVVGMAVDPVTGGYWLVASDGGIFAYNAPFLGSTGSIVLNKPIVGMEASPNGRGYRFIAADGGVFTYGSQFYGTPTFAGPPAPQGIQATFTCSGSGTGVDITYGTETSQYTGGTTLPWSTTLTLSQTSGFAYVDAQLSNTGGDVACSTTVTWPGGSATQNGNAIGAYNIASAEVCSDYPLDSSWAAC